MSKSLRRLTWRLGRSIYSRARGESASDDILTNGEAEVQRRVIAAANTGLCVLDIGAYKGDWTLPLISALPADPDSRKGVQVHLFEPVPQIRQKLKSRLANEGVGDLVRVHGLALSDTCGVTGMHIVGDNSGRNSLISAEVEKTRLIEVETATLTDVFDRLGVSRAQLVKIDAEGHDLAILRGARDLFAAGRIDVVQFEYNYTWVFSRAFLKDVFELFQGLPYSIARVRPRFVELLDSWHPELDRFFHCNYLLIQDPALAWFDVRRGQFDMSNSYA